MLPPADRLIDAQLDRYVSNRLYWVLHAPRQTGKTTFLLNWAHELNSGGEAVACYVSLEQCQMRAEPERCMPTMCSVIRRSAEQTGLPVPEAKTVDSGDMLGSILQNFSELVAPKPLVLLLDEVDALEGEAMISFLRQLRGGFMNRGVGKFPVSITLVGMRDLKDYITTAKDGVPPSPLSPFNIKADSIFIGNFSRGDVQKLFAQRTEETGQQITDEALEYVWEQSMGQPWIVNSLFMRATLRVLKDGDYSTVTLEHIKTARDQMILARETHLDSLAVRLREPPVRKIMETFFTGAHDFELTQSDAFRVCLDLGLVRINGAIGPQIANPIYREVLAREVTFGPQYAIPDPEEDGWQRLRQNGTLDMSGLLKEFQAFWRKHSEIWEEKTDYTEAFPHLLLMAFLQRVLNSGGRIEREYAAGRGRMDLAIEYGNQTHIIEIKLIYQYNTPAEVR
ncbi:MAG: ATP-binding protein, partial [Chitinispirillales bacterium]|nr:ATP-binding protein [Chitinispirillales bacterium]